MNLPKIIKTDNGRTYTSVALQHFVIHYKLPILQAFHVTLKDKVLYNVQIDL